VPELYRLHRASSMIHRYSSAALSQCIIVSEKVYPSRVRPYNSALDPRSQTKQFNTSSLRSNRSHKDYKRQANVCLEPHLWPILDTYSPGMSHLPPSTSSIQSSEGIDRGPAGAISGEFQDSQRQRCASFSRHAYWLVNKNGQQPAYCVGRHPR
jgi:hypothetical protein